MATGAGNHSCVADRGVIWQPEWFSHYAHQVVSIGYHTDYVCEVLLKKTYAGRSLQLVGDNNNAARITGINERTVRFFSYVISGALAGLLGILIVGYAGSTTLNMAESYTLLSLAAITIGGTNLSGGQGSFVAGALGAIVLTQLTSILQALNMNQGMRQVIQGGLLLIIMIVNVNAQKRRS